MSASTMYSAANPIFSFVASLAVTARREPVMASLANTVGRSAALNAAVTLRDCSLRSQTLGIERHACRTLMRQAAFRWRDGRVTVQLRS